MVKFLEECFLRGQDKENIFLKDHDKKITKKTLSISVKYPVFFDKKMLYDYTYSRDFIPDQKMKKKILVVVWVIVGALYAISQADMVLKFSDIDISAFADRFSIVHFNAPGNNFPGSIFRLPTESTQQTVRLWTHQKTCTKKLRGLYFNSQRGKRVRPLDQQTLTLLKNQNGSYYNLELSWGLYTTCDSGTNYGIFGAITYVRRGHTGYLVAGTDLNYQDNKIVASMANSFQYFDNKIPMWYIYDSNWGIGFVGGTLSGHEALIAYLNSWGSINSGFTYSWDLIVSNNPGWGATITTSGNAMETMRNIIIKGSVGLPKSIDEKERTSFLGNLKQQTIIYNGSDINSSTIINFAKEKSQELCQGQELYTSTTLWPSTQDIICVIGNNLTIDLSNNYHANKTIIVRNGDVTLEGWMNSSSSALDIFIDKWVLYLPSDPISAIDFDEDGFPDTPWVSSGLYIKGNFIINGLLAWQALNPFMHKLHLQGKITMLNTPTTPTQGRIDQITTLLGAGYENTINLQDMFKRTCGLGGTGSDGSSCADNNIITITPLVILNGNYPSNLLQ